jgi:hypothetical protein
LDDPLVTEWHTVREPLPVADPTEPVCTLSPHLSRFMGSPVATGSQFVFAIKDFAERYKHPAHDYLTFFLAGWSVFLVTKSDTDSVHYLRQSGHILSVTSDVPPAPAPVVAAAEPKPAGCSAGSENQMRTLAATTTSAPKDVRKLVDEKEKATPATTNLLTVADQILADVQNTAYSPQFKQILAGQFLDLYCVETTYRALRADNYQRIRFRTVLLMLVSEPVMSPLRSKIGEILRELA